MTESSFANLVQLIDNELQLSTTLLDTAAIAGSDDHRKQAWANAVTAYEIAERFIQRVPVSSAKPEWQVQLDTLQTRLKR
jgi:hypothetical protein